MKAQLLEDINVNAKVQPVDLMDEPNPIIELMKARKHIKQAMRLLRHSAPDHIDQVYADQIDPLQVQLKHLVNQYYFAHNASPSIAQIQSRTVSQSVPGRILANLNRDETGQSKPERNWPI